MGDILKPQPRSAQIIQPHLNVRRDEQNNPVSEGKVKLSEQVVQQIKAKTIIDAEEKSKNLVENIRIQVKNFKQNTIFGKIFAYFVIVLNVLISIQFIYLTYSLDDDSRGRKLYSTYFTIDIIVTSVFVVDWVLCLLGSENKLKFLVSFNSLVDLMTIVPVFATVHMTCPAFEQVKSARSIFYYILCGFSRAKILRSLRIGMYFTVFEDEVHRLLAHIGLRILVMILFSKYITLNF
jgi:hypothetical protein